MQINKAEIDELVAQKLVNVQKHPIANLFIYNYAPTVQYSKAWTPLLKQCRGLILDDAGNVVARPFPKFFNIEEHELHEIPNEPFEVMEKMDGSLGILYWYLGIPYIATRGSFTSEQAVKATHMLHTKYRNAWDELRGIDAYGGCTPLFEIIYPQNRIVVDYGAREELVLLGYIHKQDPSQAMVCTATHFNHVKFYNGVKDLAELRKTEINNAEGYVIRFASGFMVKAKFAEYCRLHRIVTQVSNKTIWENMVSGLPFDELLDRVPDEFYDWVKKTKTELEDKYTAIEQRALQAFNAFEQDGITADRKTFANEVLTHYKDLQGILFSILDKKDYSQTIYKMIKPVYCKPFKNDAES